MNFWHFTASACRLTQWACTQAPLYTVWFRCWTLTERRNEVICLETFFIDCHALGGLRHSFSRVHGFNRTEETISKRGPAHSEVGCTMKYFRVVLNLQTSVIGCLPFIKLRRKNESFRHLRPWFSAIRTFIDILGVGTTRPGQPPAYSK